MDVEEWIFELIQNHCLKDVLYFVFLSSMEIWIYKFIFIENAEEPYSFHVMLSV